MPTSSRSAHRQATLVMGAVAVLAAVALLLLVRGHLAPTELTTADAGGTRTIYAGQQVAISLPDGGRMGGWTIDRCDRHVLQATQTSPSSWTFEGLGPGRCDIVIAFRGMMDDGSRPEPYHVVIEVR